ncbi:MAG: hypothetical protein K0S39_457 [Paenibacillus sp.]|jgi:hypothetical protein|nr:hypothetical protein [Paenibacillus sp.]
MAIVVFWSISVLFILSFSVTRRRIHLFTGMILWCLIIHAQNIFLGMVGINFKLMKLSDHLANFLAFDSIRSVIIPISIIIFLEQTSSKSGVWKKTACWVGVIFLLVGVEYLAEGLDVLTHSEKWKLWWSFAFYTALVSLAFIVHKLISHIAQREVII